MLRKCLLIIKKESTNGYHYKVTFHCIFCKIKAKESKILICYLYFLFFCLDPYPKQTIPHPTGSGIRITTLNCILHNPYWRQQTSCLTIGRIRSNILSHTIFLKIYNFVCVKTVFFIIEVNCCRVGAKITIIFTHIKLFYVDEVLINFVFLLSP